MCVKVKKIQVSFAPLPSEIPNEIIVSVSLRGREGWFQLRGLRTVWLTKEGENKDRRFMGGEHGDC